MAATSAAVGDVAIDDAERPAHLVLPGGRRRLRVLPALRLVAVLAGRAARPDRLSICAGTLEPPTGLHTVEAWWVSEASDYHDRPDLPERAERVTQTNAEMPVSSRPMSSFWTWLVPS